MRTPNDAFSKLSFLILILIATLAQSACSAMSASTAQVGQGRGLTNIACQDPFVLKLSSEQQQWYVEIKGSRYKLSQVGDALRPIMDERKSKSVYLITSDDVRYTVLQQFTDYARQAGVTCVNWGSEHQLTALQSQPANSLTDEQWQALLTALENEDWSAAADYSLKYMKKLKNNDKENALPRLRYSFIFASAGKATEGKMTQKELEELKDFVGQEVEMPGRKIAANCRGGNQGMNTICFNDKDYDLSVAATNIHGTSIFAFEYGKLQDKFDFASHQGQWAIVDGTIKSIEINPNVLRIWALRIFLERAHITLEK